jgi:hypothetical protein
MSPKSKVEIEKDAGRWEKGKKPRTVTFTNAHAGTRVSLLIDWGNLPTKTC